MYYTTYNQKNRDQWEQGLIECYKSVFAAPPWNEKWWTDKLVREVLEQYAGENARIILAIENNTVIGFSWGAVWTGSELSKELGLEIHTRKEATVGYVKDIGVIETFRNQGIASSLLKELVSTLRQSCNGSDWVYARTLASPEPSVVYHWFPTIGFKEVCKYPRKNKRSGQVLLGCVLDSILL